MAVITATVAAGAEQRPVQLVERFPLQAIETARSLVALIGIRDQYTGSHSARVANYVRAIASEMGLTGEQTETVVFAAFLHDIGKIGIPDHILLKPGKLTDEEFAWIQKYPEWGWMALRRLDGFEEAALLVLHHHERIDGRGYPFKLKGDDIPLGARIITVADSYDALTTNRPYRPAMPHAEALAELIRCSGTQFDAAVVDAFHMSMGRQMIELLSKAR